MTLSITIQPLTDDAFAPFGAVLRPPSASGRTHYDAALCSLRKDARSSLALVRTNQSACLPITVRRMERHQYSSQSFIPLNDARALVIVAPDADGRPDLGAARAFIADKGVGVSYAPDIWHHPLTVLSPDAAFAVLIWKDDSPLDEEFVDVEPILVQEEAKAHG